MNKCKVVSFLTFFIVLLLVFAQSVLHADPTMSGGKGQLRVLTADTEPFYVGMPLLYFSFYQGYANEKIEESYKESERTLSNTFTLTFILTSKIELSTAFKGMIHPTLQKLVIEQDSYEWKLKYIAYKQDAFSFAVAPDFSFPFGDNEEIKSMFGGYLVGTVQSAITKDLPLEFNTNIGFFSSEEFLLPVGFSASLLTKYSEFFFEYSANNLTGSDTEMRITPGIRLNPRRGLTLTFAFDKTFSTVYPDKRLNLLFTWLGPFAVFGAEREETEEAEPEEIH